MGWGGIIASVKGWMACRSAEGRLGVLMDEPGRVARPATTRPGPGEGGGAQGERYRQGPACAMMLPWFVRRTMGLREAGRPQAQAGPLLLGAEDCTACQDGLFLWLLRG